jgi:hypothetical protein
MQKRRISEIKVEIQMTSGLFQLAIYLFLPMLISAYWMRKVKNK